MKIILNNSHLSANIGKSDLDKKLVYRTPLTATNFLTDVTFLS